MLLMSPSEAALAIGGKCGGSAPTDEDTQLIAILDILTSRVEIALNVDSLVLAEHVDRAVFPYYNLPNFPAIEPPDPKLRIRLCNGFLVPDTVVIKDADGVVVDTTGLIDVDRDMGVVNLSEWDRGIHTIEYLSGFEPITPDPEPTAYDPCHRVLAGIPTWIKGIVVDMLVQWYRTEVLVPRAVKDIRYGQLSLALDKILMSRIYSRYMRPRVGVTWGERRD